MGHLDQFIKYLEKNKIGYTIGHHPPAYTAQEIAAAQHVPGKQMIKSVIVRGDDGYIMCVLPATHRLDMDQLGRATGESDVRLASEEEISELFPDCELGAEPPFGNLYDIKVFADQTLEEDEEIVFNAGTHTDTVKMRFADFKRLAHPHMTKIGVHI